MSSLTLRDRIQLSLLDVLSERGIYLGRLSTKIHVALYRATRGELGSRLPGWREARILLVDHVGARSGTKRTSPVIYHEHGNAVAVVGSKAGPAAAEMPARWSCAGSIWRLDQQLATQNGS